MDYNETRIYGDQIDEFNLVFSKELIFNIKRTLLPKMQSIYS